MTAKLQRIRRTSDYTGKLVRVIFEFDFDANDDPYTHIVELSGVDVLGTSADIKQRAINKLKQEVFTTTVTPVAEEIAL